MGPFAFYEVDRDPLRRRVAFTIGHRHVETDKSLRLEPSWTSAIGEVCAQDCSRVVHRTSHEKRQRRVGLAG